MEAQRIADLNVIVDPPGDPQTNMEKDLILAEYVRRGIAPATLRIYLWNQQAVSIGRRQCLDTLPLNLFQKGIPLVRRPTGGGAVLHHREELTYALTLPRQDIPDGVSPREIPGRIHHSLRDRLVDRGLASVLDLCVVSVDSEGSLALCFDAPVGGDLLYQGKKVAGAAVRVWREGVLLQGSIQGLPVEYNELVRNLCSAVEEGCSHGKKG